MRILQFLSACALLLTLSACETCSDCEAPRTCISDVCVCPGGSFGPNCEYQTNPCLDLVCENGGTCQLTGECLCEYGYTGDRCELTWGDAFAGDYYRYSFCDNRERNITIVAGDEPDVAVLYDETDEYTLALTLNLESDQTFTAEPLTILISPSTILTHSATGSWEENTDGERFIAIQYTLFYQYSWGPAGPWSSTQPCMDTLVIQ